MTNPFMVALSLFCLFFTPFAEAQVAVEHGVAIQQLTDSLAISSVDKVNTSLTAAMRQMRFSSRGTDDEKHLIRKISELLISMKWLDPKYSATDMYQCVKELTDLMLYHSARTLELNNSTPISVNLKKVEDIHQIMLLWLKKLNHEADKAGEVVTGTYEVLQAASQIKGAAEDNRKMTIHSIANNMANIYAMERRKPTLEDMKALGLDGEDLKLAEKELD